jgi:RHS repeat-associated protein
MRTPDHDDHVERHDESQDESLPQASRVRRSAFFAPVIALLRQTGMQVRAAWRDAHEAWGHRRWPRVYWQALVNHAGKRRAQQVAFSALIACLILTGSGGLFLTSVLFPQLFGAPTVTHSPNTLDQFKNGGNAYGQNGSQTPTPHTPVPPSSGALTPAQAPSSTAATILQPVIIPLDPNRHLATGSQPAGSVTRYLATDQVLEVGLADASIDLTAATPTGSPLPTYTPAPKPTPIPTPNGPITKATPAATSALARQTTGVSAAAPAAPAVGSSTPASHLASASQGSQSSLAALAPHASGPFTLEFTPNQVALQSSHNGAWLGAFTLRVLDGSRTELTGVKLTAPLTLRFHYQPGELSGLNTSDMRLVWTTTGDQQAKKPAQSLPVSADSATTTLSASVSSLVGGPLALAASSSDQGTVSSEHLSMAGNSGDAQFVVPLQIPPAAGGLAPNLQLTYGSGGPNGRHGDNATPPPTGDGWNLSMGSISYDASNPNSAVYFLNGVGGISEPILCCAADSHGNTYFYLHHHPNVRIQVEDNSTSPAVTGKCFHVWTPDGMYYELGCTSDARRTNVNGSSLQYIEWDVNKAQRLTDNATGYLQQYTVSYWQDMSAAGGLTHTRDAYMKEIDYNFVGGAPQARVLFNIHWPGATDTSGNATATTYGSNYLGCAPPEGIVTTLRCDDPVDQAGWSAAPLVFSAITLDNVTVQLKDSGTFKTVRTYDLSYENYPLWKCWDGFALTWHACAGEHLLHQVLETPYQNNTAQPSQAPLVFSYSAPTKNEYHDTTVTNWNGGIFDDQDWWQYLTSFTDKQTGASGTIAWKLASGNTHGVPSGSALDPWRCTVVTCTSPDDRQWQRQTVYQITDTGVSPTTTTTFAYTLKQPCGTGCTQDTWIPPNQFNTCGGVAQPPQSTMQSCLLGAFSNYWMQEYTGFETVTTTHPDSSTTWQQYYAGAGWGTNDWDIANMYRDQALVTDVYQSSPTGAPLQETRSTYLYDLNSMCPVVNPSNGYQLFVTPYLLCFNHEIGRDTYQGGSSTSSPAVPKSTRTWAYNAAPPEQNHFHDELLSTTTTSNDLAKDTYSPGTISGQPVFTTTYDYTYRDGANETPVKPYYFLNLVAQIRTKDNGSQTTYWRCGQTRYDGLGYGTGASSSLKAGLPTQTDAFQACDSSGAGTSPLTTTQGYDAYGQPVVSVDADAIAGDGAHQTCPASAADDLFVNGQTALSYTTCRKYDPTYHTYTASDMGNLKNSSGANVGVTNAYDYLQGILTSTTDPNGQATTFGGPVFEFNGAASLANFQDVYTQETLPAQPTNWGNPAVPYTSRTYTYTFCANATAAARPCRETDSVRQYDGTNVLVTRQMYDRDGRLIQTRSTGPTAGQDVVTSTNYDDQANKVFTSQTCVAPTLSTLNGGRTQSSTPGYLAPMPVGNGLTPLGTVWTSGVGAFDWTKAKWIAGDFNGDGLDDAVAFYEQGPAATAAYEWLGTSTGLNYVGQVWSSASYEWSKATWISGDFNGDGKDDAVAFYDNGSSQTLAHEWLGTSAGLTSNGTVWTSGAGAFTWSLGKWIAGDFNGDGKADAMAFYDLGSGQTGAYEWLGTSSGLTYQGQVWSSSGFTWANAKWVAGDFNGDGKADAMAFYNLTGVATGAYEWLGTSSGLTSIGQVWNSNPSNFDWTKATWVAGDVNGDGKADALAFVDQGSDGQANYTAAYEWQGASSGLQYQGQVWNTPIGGFTWAIAKWIAGDFNGDGKADAADFYDLGSGQTSAHIFRGVSAITGGGTSAWIDPSVSGTNCSSGTVKGTTTYSDALGRTIATDDAAGTGVGTSGSGCLLPGGTLHHTSCATYTPVVASSTSGLPSTDGQPYMRSLAIDANVHQSASYTDALGRTAYTQQFSGASQNPVGSGITSYAVTGATYDATGAQHTVTDAMGNVTTWTYCNTVGRLTQLSDPDWGVETYTYDANGNVTKTVDARGGVAGTICATYDGLNRQTGRQQWTGSACSGTSYVTYTYDSTAGGNVGLGRLTGESFTGTFAGANQTGTYSYAYDARGEVATSSLTVLGNTYTTTAQYNELGDLKQQVYPVTNETVSYTYTGQGLLNSMQTSANPDQSKYLIDALTYSSTNGLLTGAHLGGTYRYSVTYNDLLRPQDTDVRRLDWTLLYAEHDYYDPVGNTREVDHVLPAGTDVERFCYDEQNRLTFAHADSNASPPACQIGTSGTLTSAQYSQTFTYDVLDRLTSGPAGSYTYGDAAHKHAATQVGSASNYTAQYDASSNMTCRATGGTTCGSTAAVLSYDNEGQLTGWQNKPSSPTSTDSFLYDGEGNRVAQQSASGGVTTQSVYVGDLMEARTVTGAPGTGAITYYSASGKRIALMNNGTLSYLVGDHLGSTVETLDSSGNVSGSQLYGPYGSPRYTTGSMVTDYGFTGQRADSTTGLDYYNARYYDSAPGQFTSADTVKDGQNRFGYVGGNPTTYTDPSGHVEPDAASTPAALFGGGGWQVVAEIGAAGAGIVLCLAACARAFSWVRDNWRSDSSYADDSRTAAVTSNSVLDHWWTDVTTSTGTCDCISTTITWYPPTALTPTDDPSITQPTDATPGAKATAAASTDGQPPDECGGGNGNDDGETDGWGPPSNRSGVAIGRFMKERVIPYADENGLGYYTQMGVGEEPTLIKNNMAWLRKVMRDRRWIHDIGKGDIAPDEGAYYSKERELIKKWKYPYCLDKPQP